MYNDFLEVFNNLQHSIKFNHHDVHNDWGMLPLSQGEYIWAKLSVLLL